MHRVALALLLILCALGATSDGVARYRSLAAGVLFNGDFESGTYAPWPTPQCSNYGDALGQNGATASFGPFYVEVPAVRTHSGNVVPPGQGSFFGSFNVPADTLHKQRCQVVYARPESYDVDDYYSLMIYVPVGWNPGSPAWGPTIAELNFQTNLAFNAGKALALTLRPDTTGDTLHDHVTLSMTTGFDNATQPYYTNVSDADNPSNCRGNLLPCKLYAIPSGSFKQGTWNEIIVHDRWETSNTGVVEAWYRQRGQSAWTKSVGVYNVPTLQYDATHNGESGTVLEGLTNYRAPAAVPETVYLDGFTRATSFAAAAAELP
jgi:hypothetical protein